MAVVKVATLEWYGKLLEKIAWSMFSDLVIEDKEKEMISKYFNAYLSKYGLMTVSGRQIELSDKDKYAMSEIAFACVVEIQDLVVAPGEINKTELSKLDELFISKFKSFLKGDKITITKILVKDSTSESEEEIPVKKV